MKNTSTMTGILGGLAAASLSLGTFAARPLDADDDAARNADKVRLAAVTPETVRAWGRVTKDPASPSGWSAEINLGNPSKEAVGLDTEVEVAESRGGAMSRMPAPPVVKYHTKAHVELVAGADVKQLLPIPKGVLSLKGARFVRPTSVRVYVQALRHADGTVVAAKPRPVGPMGLARKFAMVDIDADRLLAPQKEEVQVVPAQAAPQAVAGSPAAPDHAPRD